ncbi:MAG: hypothetical protein ACI3YG_04890 [Prevotella sp.]
MTVVITSHLTIFRLFYIDAKEVIMTHPISGYETKEDNNMIVFDEGHT